MRRPSDRCGRKVSVLSAAIYYFLVPVVYSRPGRRTLRQESSGCTPCNGSRPVFRVHTLQKREPTADPCPPGGRQATILVEWNGVTKTCTVLNTGRRRKTRISQSRVRSVSAGVTVGSVFGTLDSERVEGAVVGRGHERRARRAHRGGPLPRCDADQRGRGGRGRGDRLREGQHSVPSLILTAVLDPEEGRSHEGTP